MKNNYSNRTLGSFLLLNMENKEKKIHIKKLQKYGFTPTCECVKFMAFNLAENLEIYHKFNKKIGSDIIGWMKRVFTTLC